MLSSPFHKKGAKGLILKWKVHLAPLPREYIYIAGIVVLRAGNYKRNRYTLQEMYKNMTWLSRPLEKAYETGFARMMPKVRNMG